MQPVKKALVLLPARKRLDWRRLVDFLKRAALHLQIGSRINLSRFGIHVPEEVADHAERDSTLQQVHIHQAFGRDGIHFNVASAGYCRTTLIELPALASKVLKLCEQARGDEL